MEGGCAVSGDGGNGGGGDGVSGGGGGCGDCDGCGGSGDEADSGGDGEAVTARSHHNTMHNTSARPEEPIKSEIGVPKGGPHSRLKETTNSARVECLPAGEGCKR